MSTHWLKYFTAYSFIHLFIYSLHNLKITKSLRNTKINILMFKTFTWHLLKNNSFRAIWLLLVKGTVPRKSLRSKIYSSWKWKTKNSFTFKLFMYTFIVNKVRGGGGKAPIHCKTMVFWTWCIVSPYIWNGGNAIGKYLTLLVWVHRAHAPAG